jgi:acyl-coenzyme A thioesterase PaaI-like protein
VFDDGQQGSTRDVSASGAFINTPGSFDPGTPTEFTLVLKHVEPGAVLNIRCEGHVVRVDSSATESGVAVQIDAYALAIEPSVDARGRPRVDTGNSE